MRNIHIYNIGNKSLFFDRKEKQFYLQNIADPKSFTYFLRVAAIFGLIALLDEFYSTITKTNYKMLFAIILNVVVLILVFVGERHERKNRQPYYPSSNELYGLLIMIKKRYLLKMIFAIVSIVLTIFFSVRFMYTYSFACILCLVVCTLCCYVAFVSGGLAHKREIIKMIEQRKI